jgi:DNA-binding HxlR family transcriptional regulator
MQILDAVYVEHVSQALELLKKKWTIQILCAMRERPVRLCELHRLFPLASKKALTASLRSMEGANIIVRKDLSHSVLHVEYEFSATMRQPLVQLTDCLASCGASNESQKLLPVTSK